jgi:Domain of unknown function (DUF4259)
MGAWGPGPFDNDAAVEFLDKLRASPLRVVTKVLREISPTPPGEYIEIDEGGAGWAACEIVPLGFGYGERQRKRARTCRVDLGGVPQRCLRGHLWARLLSVQIEQPKAGL